MLYPMEDPEFSRRIAPSVFSTSTSLWVVTVMISKCPFGHPTPWTEMQVFVTPLAMCGYFKLLSKTLRLLFLTVNLGFKISFQIRSLNWESEKWGSATSLWLWDSAFLFLWNEGCAVKVFLCLYFFLFLFFLV